MRQEYDFKSTLKVDLVKKIYQDIIRKVIGELLEEKKKNAARKSKSIFQSFRISENCP